LQGLPYHFIVVKNGGEEGIVQLDASETVLQRIANDAHCTKLTKAQVRTLRANYLPPKLKQRYRPQQQTTDTGHTAQAAPKTICAGFLPD
jgi:hypothetical protein